jgi:hypothetical protein
MGAEIKASGWQETPLGPWKRYRRDVAGGRRVIVALAPYGGWVWDLWSMLDCPVCLAVGGDFPGAQEAMDDAGRVVARHAALTDEELIARNGVDAYVGVAAVKIVTLSEGKGCVLCGNEIVSGSSAAAEDGDGRLWCRSCASRNPGAVLDAASAEEAPSAGSSTGRLAWEPDSCDQAPGGSLAA